MSFDFHTLVNLMTATRKLNIYCLCILFGLLPAYISSFAQSKDLNAEKWVADLSKKDLSSYDSLPSLTLKLQKVDSLQAFQFLDKLAEKGQSKDEHFRALFNCLKAHVIYYNNEAAPILQGSFFILFNSGFFRK